MNLFTCQKCRQLLFFESVVCTRCGSTLAYLPEFGVVSVVEAAPASDGSARASGPTPTWRPWAETARGTLLRLCRNYTEHGVCNWAVPAAESDGYCRACRLNHMIPPIGDAHAKEAWHKLEVAKRRLVYTLLGLGLPVETKNENPRDGLAFDFLQDAPDGQARVFTGHDGGTITINIAEADAPFREEMRVQLGETYRTLLGHFRHESGHYYWERLVKDGPRIEDFRACFGDERPDYAEAMRRHYAGGPPGDWAARFVSMYASMHPWEDWAETWAHYLHMVDTIETSRAYGLSLRPADADGVSATNASMESRRVNPESFAQMLDAWFPLTNALNSFNRSMGTNDCYPFVLSEAAIQKLRFVHDVIEEYRARASRLDNAASQGERVVSVA